MVGIYPLHIWGYTQDEVYLHMAYEYSPSSFGRGCLVCQHEKCQEITDRIFSGREVMTRLSKEFVLSTSTLTCHRKHTKVVPDPIPSTGDALDDLIALTSRKIQQAELLGDFKSQKSLILA